MYPLNSLRAFEASARHQCFVKAADELFVTPAAVSQQVKKLEEYLGVILFRRLTRSVELTDSGKRLANELTGMFLQMDKLILDIKSNSSSSGIDLSVAPIFAINWLVPRLNDFSERHPNLELRIASSLEVVDFKQGGFDAGIRFGSGEYPGCTAVKVMGEWLTPMCSPEYLEKHGPIAEPDDLHGHTLLHDESVMLNKTPHTWQDWFELADVINADSCRGPRFSQPDHAHQAALAGLGVVLGWYNMSGKDLTSGRLVVPIDLKLPMKQAFYLVYPEAYEIEDKLRILREWLQAEITRALNGQT